MVNNFMHAFKVLMRHLFLFFWEEICQVFTLLAMFLFDGSHWFSLSVFFLWQATRATLACVHPTARRDTAAPAISGPKSASRCWGREKCAPSRGRKALMVWKSSSAVTVPKASPARCGKMPPPLPSPGSTCAKRSERLSPSARESFLREGLWLYWKRSKDTD